MTTKPLHPYARKLTVKQQDMLRCFVDQGGWPGNGWTYSTNSETRRLCESLAKRGLVDEILPGVGAPRGARSRFVVNDVGRNHPFLAELAERRAAREAERAAAPSYPEHEKLHAVVDKSQAIGEFVDWLKDDKGIHLARWEMDDMRNERLEYARVPTTKLLAEFFEIDSEALEAEKVAMLAAQREHNAKAS